ncbi:phosphoribosylformylglycinamidine synthase subunit PurQ [Mesobaculum littorinae]|uniref:Phosphoribosylformylglycinamidine synthase subunit PurQ n=1 Tax=Mesobaculum littorinae TaxID=2486419 RepID=A0A438ALD8_9RHOB|nr:phosphoribosylformylglycinamidine synthase subunit PurQ [Mesobaculum littorinae]RVV99489.1 phosphoribosylformylglycinamidine synthase subunit PurQ [Mesobaculum littorinae]
MKAAVLVFPGSNCDRDLAVALTAAGAEVAMVWHKETSLPEGTDLVAVPGGFSYGDYLRAGAIAARSPVIAALRDHAERGGYVFGVCNGFQILCETGLLPGTLMRNRDLRYICRSVTLRVGTADSAFTSGWRAGEKVSFPIAHHDGNYTAGPGGLERLTGEDRVAFRYVTNPNGSEGDVAGILSDNRRILGMMPHPERAADPAQGGTDGAALFRAVTGVLAEA